MGLNIRMTNIAIRVENLSKQYPSTKLRAGRIGGPQARYKTIRESLTEAVQAPSWERTINQPRILHFDRLSTSDQPFDRTQDRAQDRFHELTRKKEKLVKFV
jgi:hypothetical protein